MKKDRRVGLIRLFDLHKFILTLIHTDSPGVPPSANAHELFRGFSFIASCLLDDNMNASPLPNSNVINSDGLPASNPVADNKPTPEMCRQTGVPIQIPSWDSKVRQQVV